MDRTRIIVNEVVNFKQEGRHNAAYYKSLEGYFECLDVIVTFYFFSTPRHINTLKETSSAQYSARDPPNCQPACPSVTTLRNLQSLAETFVTQAETLLWSVVEIDSKLAAALESEVVLVTGRQAVIQPKILTPSLMFKTSNSTNDQQSSENFYEDIYSSYLEVDKLFPQIPSSRLSLDFLGVTYNSLIIHRRAQVLKNDTAKNKSNALYLANLRSVLKDLLRLQMQREALDHLIYQSQEQLSVLSLQPQILADQLSLIDVSLYTRLQIITELEYSGWLGKERRQRAPYLTAMREFAGYLSHWITWEILKPGLELQQRAELMVHFVAVGEGLSELASYHMLGALVRGLSTEAILRLGPLMELLPKRTLITWDTLQGMVLDGPKQRALLSKAPATCIPAIDTAYLSDLLSIDPELLTLKSNSSIPEAVKHKFSKYCEAIEKFRLQSTRVYGIKHFLHPAIQHFILSRPFLSSKELLAASHLILPEISDKSVPIDRFPIKPFYRRYLDDDDRLFLPLKTLPNISNSQSDHFPVEEKFSLGEQPEINIRKFHPMDDVDERAARINSKNDSYTPEFQVPIDL